MRPNRKSIEHRALSLFARALAEQGIPPIYAPEIIDRPDALFLIGECSVAIECRYLSHPKLLELLAPNSWPADHAYEVFLPTEPHLWVRDAILEKEKSVAAYKARTAAQEVWLILHSSQYHTILRDDRSEGTEFFDLLCLGPHLIAHSFNQIWIAEVATENPRAVKIFDPNTIRPKVAFDDYRKKNAPYPFEHFWFSNAMVKLKENGEKFVNINLNDLVTKPVGIQPLDEAWKIDYKKLFADSTRNVNLKDLHWEFHDEKPSF